MLPRPERSDPHLDAFVTEGMRSWRAAQPDATLAEHCAAWVVARGEQVSTTTMSRLLARLGLPLKKRP